MQRFKERLKARRNALNLSQAQLAQNAQVSERAIAGYETAGDPPSMRIVEKLARAMNVSPTWLLGGEESQFLKSGAAPDPAAVAELLAAIDQLQNELDRVRQLAEKLRRDSGPLTEVAARSSAAPAAAASSGTEPLAAKLLKQGPPAGPKRGGGQSS